VARPGLEHEHVEAALGELLGDDRPAAARADDDDVPHRRTRYCGLVRTLRRPRQ
jgi:hypothetical protein